MSAAQPGKVAEAVTGLAHHGKYKLVRKLAAGGMAEVFLAKAVGLLGFEKTVVLKRIHSHLAQDLSFIEMFLAEAKLAAQFNHPNVVQVFDFGAADGAYFIAMEYIDGPDLRELLARARQLGQPLSLSLCARLVACACEGLAYVHEFINADTGQPLGLIHRDLSPDNILLGSSGGVKVVDFGIAKAAHEHHTRVGVLKGKLAYMSPEHLQQRKLDLRTDVYALGVVLYELITGCRPFRGQDESELVHAILHQPLASMQLLRTGVPQALQRVVERALHRDPARRYASCRLLQADLERYLLESGEPAGALQLAQLVAQVRSPPPAPQVAQATAVIRGPQKHAESQVECGELLPAESPLAPASAPLILVEEPLGEQGVELQRVELESLTAPPDSAAAVAPARPWLWPMVSAVALLGLAAVVGGYRRLEAPPAAPALQAPQPLPQVVAPAEAPAPLARALEDSAEAAPAPPPRRRSPRPQAAVPPSEPPSPRPTLASLTVESVPPGQIRLDGQVVGTSPVRLRELPPGSHQVEAFDPDQGFSRVEQLSVHPGDNGTRRIVLGRGTVEFRIRPYATVLVDGRSLGHTPLEPVPLYEGTHTIQLVNHDLGKQVSLKLQVKPGTVQELKYNLAQ